MMLSLFIMVVSANHVVLDAQHLFTFKNIRYQFPNEYWYFISKIGLAFIGMELMASSVRRVFRYYKQKEVEAEKEDKNAQ